MNYRDPKLRDLLAGEYAMGLLPPRARARFERLMAGDAELQRLVADWQERLAPIDGTAPPLAPPRRIWRAVEQGTLQRSFPPLPKGSGRLHSLAFWRGFAGAAAAIALALMIYIAAGSGPVPAPTVLAVLADSAGTPAFIATRAERGEQVSVAPVRAQSLEAQKSFELWAIAGGPPKPLGLVSATPGNPLLVSASAVVTAGTVLAVSLEPEGGSPTGLPTGPVLFQGKVLAEAN
ncbi:MAG TPA: anti-sigma factor [Stellaceae bacterium]|nr:anti-sigma factor [Stellaceae bacterium]